MNILTFNIDHAERYKEYDHNFDRILEILDKRGFKATFFCDGSMATELPEVVKKIAGRGHEIGCHSFRHVRLSNLSREELIEDTRTAVDALEQCVGKKVKSYRAPDFSIGKDNKWAFEALLKSGIQNDASVLPAKWDSGSIARLGESKPVIVYFAGGVMKEYPVCTTSFFGKEIPYSEGKYFRFRPLSFIKKVIAKNDYAMLYFHVADMGSDKNVFNKMMRLIESENFINIEQADSMIDWESQSTVVI